MLHLVKMCERTLVLCCLWWCFVNAAPAGSNDVSSAAAERPMELDIRLGDTAIKDDQDNETFYYTPQTVLDCYNRTLRRWLNLPAEANLLYTPECESFFIHRGGDNSSVGIASSIVIFAILLSATLVLCVAMLLKRQRNTQVVTMDALVHRSSSEHRSNVAAAQNPIPSYEDACLHRPPVFVISSEQQPPSYTEAVAKLQTGVKVEQV